MRYATKLFLVLFWFVMGIFFFVMFSIHGIMGDIPPVTALLGMTCFGLGKKRESSVIQLPSSSPKEIPVFHGGNGSILVPIISPDIQGQK